MHKNAGGAELPELRRQKILLTLEREGKVLASELSRLFDVSEDTIRRDLKELADAGLLQRVHGGALPRAAQSGKDYQTRQEQPDSGKTLLAKAAAGRVLGDQVIILDSGTTTLQIAQSLPLDLKATVVTNSPPVLMALAGHRNIDVIISGGKLDRNTMGLTGIEAVRLMQSVRADVVFLGVCAIHPEVGISVSNREELFVKQAMIEGASEVIAVVTADKLGTAEPFVMAPITRVHTLITEQDIPAGSLEAYQQLGLRVQQIAE